jgi:hypothetical protein
MLVDPASPEKMPEILSLKRHRRFGGSVGSIPASALAELRDLGEDRGLSRSMTLPVLPVCTQQDSDSSSSDGDGEVSDEEEEEEYSWVMGNATRVVRRNSRTSLKWVKDLGGDRWIAERYSQLLQAL